MKFKYLFLLFSAVSVFACSSTPEPQIQAAPVIAQQMDVIQKGFSFSFPEQNEWTVVKNNPYKVIMSKQGESSDERYTIQALVVKLPKFKNDEDFKNFITLRMKKSQTQQQVKVIEQHAQLIESEDKMCVQYNSKEEYPGKTKTIILELVNYTCRHSARENAGIYLAYSKKYTSGSGDENFDITAAGLFNHMQLAEF